MSRSRRRTRIHELGRPEVTEIEIGRTTHRVAKVEPMDLDGVRTMTIGTALWGFAVLALLPFLGRLESADHGWWFWTAVAGFGLGLGATCHRHHGDDDEQDDQKSGNEETAPTRVHDSPACQPACKDNVQARRPSLPAGSLDS